MMERNSNTWIEISKANYAHNIMFFKALLRKECTLSVVLKANAYGHGLAEMASLAAENGITVFDVHSLEEALILRKKGFEQTIFILGPVHSSKLDEAVANNFELCAYNPEILQALNKAAQNQEKKANIHLKLETGTNRQGVMESDLNEILALIKSLPHLKLTAVYSHFANIEDTTSHDYATFQFNNFMKMVSTVETQGFTDFRKHLASSAATLLFEKSHFDMVRVGISQFGLWPSSETLVSFRMRNLSGEENLLKPVLSWKTRIGQIKTIPAGSFIGYGCTYQTTRESRIAILPIGYSDGYDRKLSNQGYVLIHGKRAPVRGRVMMNLVVADVTDIPEAKLEDEVVLIGQQGNQIIKVEQVASLSGTINYETATRIAEHIPRIIV